LSGASGFRERNPPIGDFMDPNVALLPVHSAQVMAQLAPQMQLLTSAVPQLMSLGPNTEQLVAMGRAMFQGAMQIPAASPVQGAYVDGIQQIAGLIKATPPTSA
jgi:hypothetical protein